MPTSFNATLNPDLVSWVRVVFANPIPAAAVFAASRNAPTPLILNLI